MTEDEVLQVINNVANRLASRFKFGYHELEDMRQEARLLALQGLDKYDNERPLENFLWTHVRNRLFNLKRNKYERPNKPCDDCPIKAYRKNSVKFPSECTEFEDKFNCSLYSGWFTRNTAKKNILQPVWLGNLKEQDSEEHTKICVDYDGELENKEIQLLLDKYLPIEMRSDYLKILYKYSVPKNRKTKVVECIDNILKEHGYHSEEKKGKE